MSLLSRWIRPPVALRALMSGQERVLSLGDTADSVVVATRFGLWWPDHDSWRRIGWDRIVRATWGEEGLSVVEGISDDRGIITDLPAVVALLTEPRDLPAVVRTRVQSSISRSEQVQLPAGTALIVARRVPGEDGLVWTGRLDAGTPDNPIVRLSLAQLLEQISPDRSAGSVETVGGGAL
jgi:hypothetical protein